MSDNPKIPPAPDLMDELFRDADRLVAMINRSQPERPRKVDVQLLPSQIAWLKAQPEGLSSSLRRLVADAIRDADAT